MNVACSFLCVGDPKVVDVAVEGEDLLSGKARLFQDMNDEHEQDKAANRTRLDHKAIMQDALQCEGPTHGGETQAAGTGPVWHSAEASVEEIAEHQEGTSKVELRVAPAWEVKETRDASTGRGLLWAVCMVICKL